MTIINVHAFAAATGDIGPRRTFATVPSPHRRRLDRAVGAARRKSTQAAERPQQCKCARRDHDDWIALDDALTEHPVLRWRKKHFPKVVPRYRVGTQTAFTPSQSFARAR